VDEDLTARARIRDAALRLFAEQGYKRTTIRGIATAAGVSLGLVRHHFGSKEALRDAVDTHVLAEARRLNDEARESSETGTFSMTSTEVPPYFQQYVARALMDGSTLVATMYDQMVGMTEQWIDMSDKHNTYPAHSDRRTRAAVLTAMGLGVPLMREHLARVLGVDPLTPEGTRLISVALLDLYSHTLVTPDLADAMRATLAPDNGSSS
jgi:AcrR family transcriptional regulator